MHFLGRGDGSGVWQIRCDTGDESARTCVSCGCMCRVRTSRERTVVHVPLGSDAIHLKVRVRTYECVSCARMWHDDLGALASGRTLLSRAAVDWALRRVALESASVAACARTLGCSWNALDRAVRAAGMRILSESDPYGAVTRIGVDEHVWRHGASGDRYVTVIVDLTPRADGRPARLLDMVPGRSAQAFANWLEARGARFRDRVEVVAMDAFSGWKQAAARMLRTAVEASDPFHVVHLAAGRLTMVRCRLQREATGRRGVKGERLYDCRRALLKTASLRTPRQRERVDALLADPVNDALRLAHGAYQRIIACYRHKDPRRGRRMMGALIDALAEPTATCRCPELRSLGRTLKRRRADILAYFTHRHSSNGPTEAINSRLETLRGIAMGFDNFEHHRQRSLIHSGRIKDILTHQKGKSLKSPVSH